MILAASASAISVMKLTFALFKGTYYMLLLISLMMIGFPPPAVAAAAGIISYVPSKKGIDDSWQWWCRLVEGQQAIIEDCEVHFSTSVVAR